MSLEGSRKGATFRNLHFFPSLLSKYYILINSKVTTRRSYRQFCSLALALDLVGHRWTLLIIRNLLVGPQRYSELLETLPGITTNLLAKRLKEMLEDGLITKDEDGYTLEPRGHALEPAIIALANWGDGIPKPKRKDYKGHLRWAALSLKRRYRGGLDLTLEMCVGKDRIQLRLKKDHAEVSSELLYAPNLVLTADMPSMARAMIAREPLESIEKNGDITVAGSRRDFRRIQKAFCP